MGELKSFRDDGGLAILRVSDCLKDDVFRHERARFYLDLLLVPEKSGPRTLQDLYINPTAFAKAAERAARQTFSEKDIERLLMNAHRLIMRKPTFFPCAALTFEFLTVLTDFCESTVKKFKLRKPKHVGDLIDTHASAAIGFAVVAVNEHFGLTPELRRVPRGRIPIPPGRRGFSHYCPRCRGSAAQRILFSYVNYAVDPEIPTEYSLTECGRCHEPGLFMREDEGLGFLPRTEYHLWRGELRKHAGIVPPEVGRHYRSATDYEKVAKWDAVVLEVGRTLEAIVKHFVPTSRKLADGLRHLDQAGIITADLYKWANELRALRNLSAHASDKSFSQWEASSAFDFLDAIIETIFWNRRQFEHFQQIRATATSDP